MKNKAWYFISHPFLPDSLRKALDCRVKTPLCA